MKQSYKNLNQIHLRTYSFYIYLSLVGPTEKYIFALLKNMGKGQNNFFFWDIFFKVSISFKSEENKGGIWSETDFNFKIVQNSVHIKCPFKNKS